MEERQAESLLDDDDGALFVVNEIDGTTDLAGVWGGKDISTDGSSENALAYKAAMRGLVAALESMRVFWIPGYFPPTTATDKSYL